ncbi:MAG: hypothetical protein AMXMBFR84_41540 [Candidatus Hydrogenedentota bacterium]
MTSTATLKRCLFAASLVLANSVWASPPPLQFNRDIRPILAEKCFKCHGPDDSARKAGLRLDDRENAVSRLRSEGSGPSAFVERITSDDAETRMPPPDSHKELTPAQREVLVRWANEGAEYEPHWAFVASVRPEVPAVRDRKWPVTEIDYFILRELEANGLSPSAQADRSTLLRRVTLDLTGLPPTAAETESFLSDISDDAYDRVVDRLFASPQYGEHMALDWLEAARYADTDGYQNDRLRYMHVWRDWVILAMNENLPFDQFVIEQLAGDLLPSATLRQQIATGFNRNHRINSENGSLPDEWLVEYVADRVDTFGTVFLGLTMGCARCHDHKYDPVTQREYYGLFAYFNNVPEWGIGPNNGNSPPFVEVPAHWPHLQDPENVKQRPEPVRLKYAKANPPRPQAGAPNTVMVMEEMEIPRTTFLLRRGLYNDPDTSQAIRPGVPAAMMGAESKQPEGRLELARWLTRPDHPLLARVTVNRYWQHFFGRGIVGTSENFGMQGEFPSHPELLDWLALEFVLSGWDVKAIHKRIVMSAAYRQSSVVTDALNERDPENRFIARGPRLRLTAQQLRDQALFASGLLVQKVGGPSVKPYMPPGLWESVSNATYEQGTGEDLYRRSIYTYWRRTTPPPMMTAFDAANRETCIVRRQSTNTPLHALTLMNNVEFVESARFLAEKMLAGGDSLDVQVSAGFVSLLSREPDVDERSDLKNAFEAFYAKFRAEPQRAEKLLMAGPSPFSSKYDKAYLASMTMTASVLLNLDEAIMRN